MRFQFYNSLLHQWLPYPKQPVYLANMPVALITKELFIVHHAIPNAQGIKRETWTVSHAETSARLAGGGTRDQAMANASKEIRLAGSVLLNQLLDNARQNLKNQGTTPQGIIQE